MWAPAGDRILFVRGRKAHIDLCLVNRDGSGLRSLLSDAFGPCWSGDGRSVYFSRTGRIERLDLATGSVVPVRSDRAMAPAVSREGGVLFFTRPPEQLLGLGGESEVCRAAPEDGPAEVLARVASWRVPLAEVLHLHVNLSPDGRWLACPLLDSTTANIWLIPADGGPMRAVTDFGGQSVFIARWISWSHDSRHVYAAVADIDADIVLLEGALG
jgi:Tol biopolymer transport system component